MKPTVILLHGLARSGRSLKGLASFLSQAGYSVWAPTYPSRRLPIAALAAGLAAEAMKAHPGADLVAVTHSLGGILVRHMEGLLPLRGVVMLAPPNQGSQLAQRMQHVPAFRWLYGPAGQELARPTDWPPPPSPFAVIAGTVSGSLGNPTSWLSRGLRLLPLSEPSDGTVTVEETRLPGMVDFRTVEASHTWIMDHPQVRGWVLRFLETGSF